MKEECCQGISDGNKERAIWEENERLKEFIAQTVLHSSKSTVEQINRLRDIFDNMDKIISDAFNH